MGNMDLSNEIETINDSLARNVPKWFVNVSFLCGWVARREADDEKRRLNTDFLTVPPATIGLSYFFRSGALYAEMDIYLNREERPSIPYPSKALFTMGTPNELMVFDSYKITNEQTAQIVDQINQSAVKFFGGVLHIDKTFCKCEMPVHPYPQFTTTKKEKAAKRGIYLDDRYGFCEWRNDKWVCKDCIEYYEEELPRQLQRASVQESEQVQLERAKMTASLRWQILTRDSFTCRACGRSPLKGDNVKLHVDHIKAIAKGGKTEPKNLHTLCVDCNLGKSDSEHEQYSLFTK